MKLADQTIRDRLELPLGDWYTKPKLRDSAVLAIVVERDGVDHLIFNKRRDDLPYHPGQICFPGGARDDDEDVVSCALRETCEEMGLQPDDFEVLGRMPDRVSIAGFSVTPLVARLVHPRPFTLAADEVAEAFEVPVADVMHQPWWSHTVAKHPLARYRRVPRFHWRHERNIWGLTGIILRDFSANVLGFAPEL